jgi:hypothetical protein
MFYATIVVTSRMTMYRAMKEVYFGNNFVDRAAEKSKLGGMYVLDCVNNNDWIKSRLNLHNC